MIEEAVEPVPPPHNPTLEDTMYTYFVFMTAPNAPVFIQGIFRDFHEARTFAKKADGYRTIRKLPLTDWNFGPLPEYNDTEAIG